MTPIPNSQLIEVLRIFSFEHTEDIWWRENEEDRNRLDFYVNCSDLFYWGTSDIELITAEKLGILYEAKAEIDALNIPDSQKEYGLLFCAKIRGMRPQGAYYKYLDESLWPLFDECGPMREVGLGNPTEHPTAGKITVTTEG